MWRAMCLAYFDLTHSTLRPVKSVLCLDTSNLARLLAEENNNQSQNNVSVFTTTQKKKTGGLRDAAAADDDENCKRAGQHKQYK